MLCFAVRAFRRVACVFVCLFGVCVCVCCLFGVYVCKCMCVCVVFPLGSGGVGSISQTICVRLSVCMPYPSHSHHPSPNHPKKTGRQHHGQHLLPHHHKNKQRGAAAATAEMPPRFARLWHDRRAALAPAPGLLPAHLRGACICARVCSKQQPPPGGYWLKHWFILCNPKPTHSPMWGAGEKGVSWEERRGKRRNFGLQNRLGQSRRRHQGGGWVGGWVGPLLERKL